MNNKILEHYPQYDDDYVNKAYVDEQIANGGNGITEEERQKWDTAYEKGEQFTQFYNIEYPADLAEKSQVWYTTSDNDPSNDWSTSLEKSEHIGDVWFQSDTGKTLVYYAEDNEGVITYVWKWQNVPNEVLSRIDGAYDAIQINSENINKYNNQQKSDEELLTNLQTQYDLLNGNIQSDRLDITKIQQDVTNLETDYARLLVRTEVSSGYNLLYNSVLIKERSDEDWILNATTPYCIYQKYSVMTNKFVSISFKYKKTNSAPLTIDIYDNGVVYKTIINTTATTNGWVEYSYTYKATITNPYLRIHYSNYSLPPTSLQNDDVEDNSISKSAISIDGGVTLITDLIVTYDYDYTGALDSGRTKIRNSWSPNANEIVGKTYWFDYTGLTMIDTSNNNKMHLDCDSMDFILKKGTKTYNIGVEEIESEKIEAYQQYKIGDVVIKKIDDDNIIIY